MKASYYNIYIKHNTKNVICFNTKLNAYCIISEIDSELLKKDITLLATHSPNVYNNLVKRGFIINENINEYEELCKEYHHAVNDSSTYKLVLLPSLDCNLRCWYCYERHIHGSHISEQTSKSIFKFVENLFQGNPNLTNLQIDLFGGEPLLYFEKELYPLLKQIKEYISSINKNVSFFFITNAVCINEKNIPLFNDLKASFQISIDGSKEQHNNIKFIPETKTGTYDHVIKVIHKLTKELEHCYINLRINYDEKNLSQMKYLIEELSDIPRKKIGIHLERVWQTIGFSNYDNEELKYTINLWMKNGFNVSYMNLGRRSYSCKASAKYQSIISYDGAVYKCTGRDFTPKHQEGILQTNGTIKWNENKLAERLNILTYDNDMCRTCNFLPLCWGPCCQKQMESPDKNFTRYCQKRGMEISIADYVRYRFNNEYIKTNRK